MKIVICDDKMSEAQLAKELIITSEGNKDIDVDTMLPVDMNESLDEEALTCDLAILDIEYDNMDFNGISLAGKINEKLPNCQIIYLTGILEFATDVYETKHCYFVMKNNMKVMLPKALDKAYSIYEENQNQALLKITSHGRDVYLKQKDIIYIEREERKLCIHTSKGDVSSYTSLRKLLGDLSDQFVRCHGGFVVNLAHIASVNGERLTMDNGQEIFVSRTYYDHFVESYLAYYAKRV